MNNTPDSEFIFYVATTPEKLWDALTRGEFTQQYFFGRRMESDWKVGSPWKLLMEDGRIDCQGKVLESIRSQRLSITWRVEWLEEFRNLPEARVVYQIDPLGEVVRLTVSEFHDPSLDEKYKAGGRKGWPMILSGLKTLLETGHPLPPFKFPDAPATK